MSARQHAENSAVRLRARQISGGQRAARAGSRLDDELNAELACQGLGENARDDVRVAARREAVNESHRSLGPGGARDMGGRETGRPSQRCAACDSDGHGVSSPCGNEAF
jgi:hypothetical protein